MPKRTSVNIQNDLYLLAVSEGLDVSAFLNLALAAYFEVPEDPRTKLIREKCTHFVLRIKNRYNSEMKEILAEHASQNTIDEATRKKDAELVTFGEYLKKSSAFPIFERCLKRKEPEGDILELITLEVNRMNGHTYEEHELWNKAITWYNKYGGKAA